MQYTQSGHLSELINVTRNNDSLSEIFSVRCSSCGAEFFCFQVSQPGSCPVCQHTIVGGTLKKLPQNLKLYRFTIDQEGTKESLKKWIENKKTAKAGFRKFALENPGETAPLYLPFWNITVNSSLNYKGKMGTRVWWGGSTKTSTNWEEKQGEFIDRSEWLFCAMKTLPATHLNALAPWKLDLDDPCIVPDEIKGLAGVYSQGRRRIS